jgi:nucleoside 2-deoxyribosyltransferase
MSDQNLAGTRRATIAICGSMAFINKMERIATELEGLGCEALAPVRDEHGLDSASLARAELLSLKKHRVDSHLDKIRRADAVLIANLPRHGVDGYVGASTLMEAAFAYAAGIPVIFLHDPWGQTNGLECASICHGCVEGDLARLLTLI